VFYKGGKMAATSPNSDLHGFGDEIRKELKGRIPRDKKLRVLDVGTGFGINVEFLARRLAKGSLIWTVDPSKEVLAEVKGAMEEEVASLVKFAEASAEHLGFVDGFFDIVVSVMVLHHMERLQPPLAEMARVLRPGGTLLIVDYKPEASHELEFKTRHEENDFFKPSLVFGSIKKLGLSGESRDFGVWYLVEVEKPLTRPRSPARGGRARPRAAR